ncbi:MAG: hypothetical protein CMJ78_08425 [Planctomycetaceae bacterium]|nr:hypothetical protein [Planctomycetaceae bacterium]
MRLIQFSLIICLALQSFAVGQETTEEAAEKASDPTTPSKRFEETMAAIKAAGQAGDEVKKLLKENETLTKRVEEVLALNSQMAETLQVTNEKNRELTTAMEALLKENEQLSVKIDELEFRMNDVSQIELHGLMIGEDKAAALVKLAGIVRIINVGETFTVAAGSDKRAAQTVHVKEINKDGVHIELTVPGENGAVKKSVVIR